MDILKDNPFYDNHLFTKADIDRCKLTWRHKLGMFFKPMFVQISEGYAIHFKVGDDGAYYIYKFENLQKELNNISNSELDRYVVDEMIKKVNREENQT